MTTARTPRANPRAAAALLLLSASTLPHAAAQDFFLTSEPAPAPAPGEVATPIFDPLAPPPGPAAPGVAPGGAPGGPAPNANANNAVPAANNGAGGAPAGAAGCTDAPNWKDVFNDSCAYYKNDDICQAEGGPESDGGMGPANQNCCVCGGGMMAVPVDQGEVGGPPPAQTAPVVPAQPAQPAPQPAPAEPLVEPAPQPQPGPTNAGETTTLATTPTGEVGTCGNKDRGNGVCANGMCCSKHGHCGTTEAHCDGTTFPPTAMPSTELRPTPTPTTKPPTPSPTKKNYEAITPGHRKFCGPKRVGGYAVASANCSFETECGKKGGAAGQTAFGSSGNDCPKGSMCFDDIRCEPPTTSPTPFPTDSPTVTSRPTIEGQTQPPTTSPTLAPTSRPTTSSPTGRPTRYKAPTVPPAKLVNSITTRGSYCGPTFDDAVATCSPETRCNDDDECDGGKCWINISCTFHASESDNFVGDVDDDVYGTELGGSNFGEEYTPEDVVSGGSSLRALSVGAVLAVASSIAAGALLV